MSASDITNMFAQGLNNSVVRIKETVNDVKLVFKPIEDGLEAFDNGLQVILFSCLKHGAGFNLEI